MGKPDTTLQRARERSMLELLEEAKRLAGSPQRIQTEEGRLVMNFITRLIETMLHGEPKTPSAEEGRHHG